MFSGHNQGPRTLSLYDVRVQRHEKKKNSFRTRNEFVHLPRVACMYHVSDGGMPGGQILLVVFFRGIRGAGVVAIGNVQGWAVEPSVFDRNDVSYGEQYTVGFWGQ